MRIKFGARVQRTADHADERNATRHRRRTARGCRLCRLRFQNVRHSVTHRILKNLSKTPLNRHFGEIYLPPRRTHARQQAPNTREPRRHNGGIRLQECQDKYSSTSRRVKYFLEKTFTIARTRTLGHRLRRTDSCPPRSEEHGPPCLLNQQLRPDETAGATSRSVSATATPRGRT